MEFVLLDISLFENKAGNPATLSFQIICVEKGRKRPIRLKVQKILPKNFRGNWLTVNDISECLRS